jgi:type I restriction-modification system DNA methylase subunit
VAAPASIDEIADRLGYRDAEGYISRLDEARGAQRSIWRDLSQKCGVDAAYFRGAVPLVAFAEASSADEARATQRRLWNFGRVPVLIVTTPDEVSALSCVVGPRKPGTPVLRSARPEESVLDVLGDFTRYSVETGKTARTFRDQFARRHRVDSVLLENLRRLRDRLTSQGVSADAVAELIGRSIFIRYMEDRHILSTSHVQELANHASYIETLRSGASAVTRLYRALSNRFNGDVFSSALTAELPANVLALLADFFAGSDLDSGQGRLWPYDFSIVPTELISSIYEQLLAETQRADAAYYTPKALVDLVLDEVLPWDGGAGPVRMLDPACGSGIFLAEAFERLAHRLVADDGGEASYQNLTALLTSSIHGVDKSLPAIRVAAFSLYLRLLEHVDPPTIWNDVRLPNLVGTNLVHADYFADHLLSRSEFEVIVGNPPWQSSLTDDAERYVRNRDLEIPDQQIAHAFLWRVREQTVDGGAIGLVLPAKLLHNRSRQAVRARAKIFSEIAVDTVVDLSPLRKSLFGAGSSPACVLIANIRDREGGRLLHVVPTRNPLSTAVDAFIIDQDRVQRVDIGRLVSDTYIWKTLLWGRAADIQLVSRLRRDFDSVDELRRKKQWAASAGFQVSGGDQNDAREIAELPYLPTSSVEALHLSSLPEGIVGISTMHRPRDPRIYRSPHLVMRKGFDDYPTSAYVEFDAAFTDGLFGIAGPPGDEDELRAVATILNSDLARYWFFMTSSSWGVEREQIHLNEYLSLPLPVLEAGISKRLAKLGAPAGQGAPNGGVLVGLNEAVFDAYALTARERQLIRDSLAVTVNEYRFGPESVAFDSPTGEDMELYSGELARQLADSSSVRWTVITTERKDGYTAVQCTPADASDDAGRSSTLVISDLIGHAESEARQWKSPASILHPAVTILLGLSVYIVKPDERRCWRPSDGVADASRVFEAVLLAPLEGAESA